MFLRLIRGNLSAYFSFCPSRVEGGLVRRTAVPRRVQLRPKWTTCMGLKRGRAGSNSETNSSHRVSIVSTCCPCLASLSWTHCPHKYYCLVHPGDIKEDILECNSAELSFALAHFIQEVRRPNGETYSPDSIFYLCLGIQQVQTLVGSHIYIQKSAPLAVCRFLTCSVWLYLDSTCLCKAE